MAQTLKGRIAITVGGTIVTAPLSYVIQRVLGAWGVLDDISDTIGRSLKVNVPPAAAGWLIALIVCLGLYGLLLWKVWRPRHIHHLPIQAKTKPEASCSIEFIPTGSHIADRLRAIRSSDPLPFQAHIDFLDNVQRPMAETLRDLFEVAGWKTSFSNVPHDRYTNRHAVGLEITGPNKLIVSEVSKILSKLDYGPIKVDTVAMDIDKESPKWAMGMRTVRLFIGYPTANS